MGLFVRLLLTLTTALVSTTTSAQSWLQNQNDTPVKAELISQYDAATPGKTLQLGLSLTHAKGWHTYWKATGDTGLPTRIEWTLPDQWSANDISWPTPSIFTVGSLVNYGYGNQVLLPISINVPSSAPVGLSVPLTAKVSWLMCETQCVPGGATLTLTIPVASQASISSANALFEKAKALIPEPTSSIQGTIDEGSELIEFSLGKELPSAKQLLFYSATPEAILYGASQNYRPSENEASLIVKATSQLKANSEIAGLVVADGGPQEGGWAKEFQTTLKKGTVVATEQPTTIPSSSTITSLGIAAAMALLGGLILNLMPCVFPVLSLKILGLIENRHKSSLAPHGVAFLAGILSTMLVLASMLIVLKNAGASIGWGFQLQSPWFIALLALLFVAITANLAGFFEFTWGSSLSNNALGEKASQHSVLGSFATGILAVIVASPCTAPFMGAALGYAMTASTLESLTVFFCLGLGMSLPWLVLTLVPSLTRWLPKPGRWMLAFRYTMALPMALTTLWLLWVLWQQVGLITLTLFIAAAVTLLVGLIFLGRIQFGSTRLKPLMSTALFTSLFLYGVGTSGLIGDAPAEPEKDYQTWSEAAVQEALTSNRPVFVDFTASWCVTCQANKLTVLKREAVQTAFETHNFVVLEADWTNQDESISKALAQFGRQGVPLYLVYSKSGQVEVLPELLTQDIVLEAILRATR